MKGLTMEVMIGIAAGSGMFSIWLLIWYLCRARKEKERIVGLTDYLENQLAPRLETEKENAMEEGIRKREKYAKELLKEIEAQDAEQEDTSNQEGENVTEQALQPVMNQYQEELETLLEEFFA